MELDDGCEDAAYLAALDAHLGPVLDAARPELVFYLGGADPYVHDRFGRLGLTVAGLLEPRPPIVRRLPPAAGSRRC